MRKLMCDQVRNKAFSAIASQVRYIPDVHAMSIASRHIEQTIVFQIQEDLENAS